MNQFKAISRARRHGWELGDVKFVGGGLVIILTLPRGKGKTPFRVSVNGSGSVSTLL